MIISNGVFNIVRSVNEERKLFRESPEGRLLILLFGKKENEKMEIRTKKTILEREWGSDKQLRVTIDKVGDDERISIRQWFQDKEGNYKPGKGICLHFDQLDDVITALQKAKETLE